MPYPLAAVRNRNSASSFDPANPSDGLSTTVWFKAEVIAGLNDGDTVASWPDSSGNNHAAVEATYKPTYEIESGKPHVHFTASQCLVSTFTLPVPVTIIQVMRVADLTLASKQLFNSKGDPSTFGFFHMNAATNNYKCADGTEFTRDLTSGFAIVTITFSETNESIYVNGALMKSLNGTYAYAKTTGMTLGNSAYGIYGDRAVNPNDLKECMIYAGVLTDAQRSLRENYLAAKHGIGIYTAGGPTITVNRTKTLVTGTTAPNIDWHGRSTCVTRADGVMVMAYNDADAHITLIASNNRIRFSDDYGETWTDADVTLAGAAVVGSMTVGEPYLTQAPNGDLLLFLGRGWQTPNGGTWFSRSTDGGETWTAAAAITITGITGNTDYLNLIDDSFIYDGTIYLSGRISTNAAEAGCKSVLVKSTDNGANWTYLSDISDGVSSTNEVGIEYLGNNRIIAMMRAAGNPPTTMFRSYSNDMGLTWSGLDNISYMPGIVGKNRIYTKTHLEGGANWWNDPILFMVGFEFVGVTRYNCVWISKNAGLSWTPARRLDTGFQDGGYGDMFYNPDTGEYVSLNYHGDTTSTFAAASLYQYNFSVNW